MIVIDASMTGSLVLPDEPDVPEWLELRLIEGPIIVPAHWRLEVANMLKVAIRRGRISQENRRSAVRQLETMGVEFDGETNAMAWHETLVLCDRYNLTSYDAAYLELASRRGAALATLDKRLIEATEQSGVPLLCF